MGSCLTLENELSEETHILTKQKALMGRGTSWGSSMVREPRRIALPRGLQSPILWEWSSFSGLWPIILLGLHLVWLRVLLGDAPSSQPRWTLGQGFLIGFSLLWAPPKLLVHLQDSTMFLIRASCCETTHASSYYLPGQGGQFQTVIP